MKRATAALLLDTLRLRNAPLGLAAAWAAVDTRGLLALVRYEGAELWLSRRLRDLGITAPEPFATDLRAAVRRTTLVNMQIDAQTLAVTALLSSADIPWALVKGQARRAAEARYPMANARPISDVDLLVPDAQIDAAWTLLCERGFKRVYEEGEVDWVVHHHLPVLVDANNVTVELHRTLNDSVAPAEAWRRATEGGDAVSWSGIETRVPNATELLWQALSHAVADGDRSYNLRTFLNVACILASEASVDWGVVESRLGSGELAADGEGFRVPRERVCRTLGLAAMLAGAAVPAPLRSRIVPDLAKLLAWRGTVLASGVSGRIRERLLQESVRLELALPFARLSGNAGPTRIVRGWALSSVWRAAYRGWSLTLGR